MLSPSKNPAILPTSRRSCADRRPGRRPGRRPHRRPRHGVLLLIVLSLLVLFVLIGVTFVVVATQYTRTARELSKHELKGDRPTQELDDALLMLLRGSTDVNNPLHVHSLLEDLYGTDGFRGRFVSRLVTGTGGFHVQQYLAFEFQDLSQTARPSENYYSGSVLTLLDQQGAPSPHSTRILRYIPPKVFGGTLRPGQLYIQAFEDLPVGFQLAGQTSFIVNGRAFNGPGRGNLFVTGSPDAGQINGPSGILVPGFGTTPLESALMPFRNHIVPLGTGVVTTDSDESWDAADYQNVFLARLPAEMPINGIATAADPLIPSFHRPFLLNYLLHRLDDEGTDFSNPVYLEALSHATARPLPNHHPFFTGSNPAYLEDKDGLIPDAVDVDFGDGSNTLLDVNADELVDIPLIRGPWDVDNDRDGMADSIWVDLGAPIKTSPDGRRYKPLFAVLCLDMDGRLNLNAHGTREMLALPSTAALDVAYADATNPPFFTLGEGYGPADIQLGLGLVPFTGVVQRNLLAGLLTQRYQPQFGEPITPPLFPNWPLYDLSISPGQNSLVNGGTVVDPDANRYVAHNYGLPGNYADATFNQANTIPNLYGSPADLNGVGGIYLDHRGQPRYIRNQLGFPTMGGLYRWDTNFSGTALPYMTPVISNEALDDPYEMDLVNGTGGNDSPFDEYDLEYLLRHREDDARIFQSPLQRALTSVEPTLTLLPNDLRNRLTTRSFDIPVLNAAVTDETDRAELMDELATGYNQLRVAPYTLNYIVDPQAPIIDPAVPALASTSLVEIARKRLIEGNNSAATPLTGIPLDDFLTRQLNLQLAPEIRAGNRFNINRLFGNGLDDNNNGAIDEPLEWLANGESFRMGPEPVTRNRAIEADPNYGFGANANNPVFTRQQYARHLFCLAMLTMDRNFTIEGTDRQTTVRRIAQWAINAVDFRDSDAIMTPFEYDWQPFDEDGWSIDDDYRTNDNSGAIDDRRIVWGTEAPELLISESLAFHDRRVKDTPAEATGEMEGRRLPMVNTDGDPLNDTTDVDNDLDQVKIPQGSLFLELYAAGQSANNNPVRPRELYTPDGQFLDLGRTADGSPTGSPVWRIAIVAPPETGGSSRTENERLVNTQDNTTWDAQPSALFKPQYVNSTIDPNTFKTELINDIGLMADAITDGVPDLASAGTPEKRRFFVFTNQPPAAGAADDGTYYYNRLSNPAFVAPGDYLVAGPRDITYLGFDSVDPTMPGDQRIQLGLNNVIHGDGTTTYWNVGAAAFARQPVGVILQARVASGSGVWEWSGMNVSEPTPHPLNSSAYISTTRPQPIDPEGTLVSPVDTPYDTQGPLAESLDGNPVDRTGPTAKLTRNISGTHENFRVALLQRLADPTQPWNSDFNPYITVDSQMIDITVFNGEERSYSPGYPSTAWQAGGNPLSGEPYDIWNPQSAANVPMRFTSRERGQQSETLTFLGPNIWSPFSTSALDPSKLAQAGQVATITGTTPVDLTTDDATLATSNHFGRRAFHTLGMLNIGPYSPTGVKMAPQVPDAYIGSPMLPFAWYNWNNRPYISNLELMYVPTSSPWRMAYEMRRFPDATVDLEDEFHAPFVHLLNFSHVDSGGPDPNLAALLDWVDVPSRFVGTQKRLSPVDNSAALAPPLQEYGAPHNFVSRFREPGKVNVNTMAGEAVWNAIDPRLTTTWNDIQRSLAGDGTLRSRPAFYSNPVRAAAAADIMPLDTLKPDTPADATLLRRDPGNNDKLLFEFVSPLPVNSSQRHPYFRYHKAQRLGNLLTSHSNVYAVWITVGYFEVFPWPDPLGPPLADPAHPDGYQLGAEMGSDTGDIKRHRGFYLIDRSIPVGFERGKDHNVKDAIILRRFIE